MKTSNSQKIMHQFARNLTNDPVSFQVHYWGKQRVHPDNFPHKHSFFEICYVMDGKGVYWEEGEEFLLQKGTIFCSRPGKMHQIHKGENMYLVYVGFEVDEERTQTIGIQLFDQLANTPHFFVAEAGDSPAALIWRALTELSESPGLPIAELIQFLAHSLLLSLQALFCKSEPDLRMQQQNQVNSSSLLHKAKLFIMDNLTHRLSLEEVASQLHISTRHLSRLFSELENKPFSNYVRSERVRVAAEMLRNTNRTIKSISEETGFSTVHYFTKVFLDETNFTPGEYRKIGKSSKIIE